VLNTDKAQLARVTTIASASSRRRRCSRRRAGWNWQFNVQKTKELNAYCMPGGRIMVYSGSSKSRPVRCGARHGDGARSRACAARTHARTGVARLRAAAGALGCGRVTGVSEGTANIANMVAEVTFQLPFSREQESEADQIGLELMARAGYDPRAAVTLWNKMAAAEARSAEIPEHASGAEGRIKDIEKNLPRVLPLYAKELRETDAAVSAVLSATARRNATSGGSAANKVRAAGLARQPHGRIGEPRHFGIGRDRR
jgi:predicted Zn-dependent protease